VEVSWQVVRVAPRSAWAFLGWFVMTIDAVVRVKSEACRPFQVCVGHMDSFSSRTSTTYMVVDMVVYHNVADS
jgi:hypothetical protein